jgi:hypothetical protein
MHDAKISESSNTKNGRYNTSTFLRSSVEPYYEGQLF